MSKAQDDSREKRQCDLFGLDPNPKTRSNTYQPDAFKEIDGQIESFELKTFANKRQVATSSRLRLSTIEKHYKEQHWLFTSYDSANSTQPFLGTWYCHGKDLQPWYDRVYKRWNEGTATHLGWDGVLEIEEELKKSDRWIELEPKVAKLKHTINIAGINNLGIPNKLLKEMTTKVDSRDHLMELIRYNKEKNHDNQRSDGQDTCKTR